MQNKNNLDDFEYENQDSKSNKIKINVDGNSSSHQQATELTHQQRRNIDEIGAGRFSSDESGQVEPARRRKSFSGERSFQRVDLREGRQSDRRSANIIDNGRPPRKNMDIRWMHEDEEVFSEAMQEEVKAINFKIKIFVLVMIVLIGGVGYWFYEYGMQAEAPKETASINDLLSSSDSDMNGDGAEISDENSGVEIVDENESDSMSEDDLEDNSSDEDVDVIDDDTSDVKDPSEIAVQVLNGGAKTGVAGDLTNILKNKLYVTKSATNANNNVSGVVIYYKSGLNKEATELSRVVPQVYGSSVLEESDDVARKYGVDVVVVVGE